MIKAIIFDIYGTLLKQDVGDLADSIVRKNKLISSFSKIKKRYSLDASPEEIYEAFINSINTVHKIKESKGIKYPEVKIENIWNMILKKIGYKRKYDKDFLFKIAGEHQNIFADRKLYVNTSFTLSRLKELGIKIGIVSNAQFYTEIDMEDLLKKDLKIKNMYNIFDKKLSFYSYIEGCSKPNQKSFIKLKEELRKYNIKPNEALFVGNDMLNDIDTAKKAGLLTCLTINKETKLRKDKKLKTRPDYKITDLNQIKDIVKKQHIKIFKKINKDKKYSLKEFKKIILPTIKSIISKHNSNNNPNQKTNYKNKHTTIIGIQGGQGTGKSTLARYIDYYLEMMGYKVESFSIDDFYKTYKERKKLQDKFKDNPYYQISRGLPGTHRVNLLTKTLQRIKKNKPFNIPQFDKSKYKGVGDVLKKTIQVKTCPDFILFEGYCVGLPNTDLKEIRNICKNNKINIKSFDSTLKHTKVMIKYIKSYQKIWKYIDHMIILQEDSSKLQIKWRLEQEKELKKKKGQGMTKAQIITFVNRFLPISYLCYKKIKEDIRILINNKHEFYKIKIN